ncbi:MAG: thiosulfate/3-mercaptopyruvate sulfurtransferase [Sulfurospirillum sp.]|jgi:thiosulfate/3-mercaptopyruvate sulfurtransferase|nr:thiosulfate/3-mercaptopyruvate sulfurtransferase [Sulfurospirillum sp.]DAB33427.1 MAG TPA: sulfurtransferase [Sulfurospirillum sp. UBA12182]
MRRIFLFVSFLLITFAYASEDILISAQEAKKLIGKPNVVFVTGDSEDIFKTGHIKGSVEMYAHHLHHSDKTGHMHCAPLFMCVQEAEEYIGSKGIGNDTLVIAYDNFRGPNATGVYAFFKSFGHEKIKILNGGRSAMMKVDPEQQVYDAIKEDLKKAQEQKVAQEKIDELKAKLQKQEAKLLVVKGDGEKITPKKYKIDTSKINYDFIAGKNEVLNAVKDILKNGQASQYVIIDTRGFTEIMGERKLDNVARGGHIPGAKFIEWSNLTDFDKELSFQDLEKMKQVFEKYGVTKDKKVYAYCHVGAGRSSHIITALELLGYPHAKVYTGSWDEWGNDMNLPIRR